MKKEDFITITGSEELYEKYKKIVISRLKKQIELSGYEEQFAKTDIYERFADMYMEAWLNSKKINVEEIIGLKNKSFTEEEIKEYIDKNPVKPEFIKEKEEQDELGVIMRYIKGKKISFKNDEKEEIYNIPRLLSRDEAIDLMTKANTNRISDLMEKVSLGFFLWELNILSSGFLRIESNPKKFKILQKGSKRRAKQNIDGKPVISDINNNKDNQTDFDVSSNKIILEEHENGFPCIVACFPERENSECSEEQENSLDML